MWNLRCLQLPMLPFAPTKLCNWTQKSFFSVHPCMIALENYFVPSISSIWCHHLIHLTEYTFMENSPKRELWIISSAIIHTSNGCINIIQIIPFPNYLSVVFMFSVSINLALSRCFMCYFWSLQSTFWFARSLHQHMCRHDPSCQRLSVSNHQYTTTDHTPCPQCVWYIACLVSMWWC